jgi:hypothetical protein
VAKWPLYALFKSIVYLWWWVAISQQRDWRALFASKLPKPRLSCSSLFLGYCEFQLHRLGVSHVTVEPSLFGDSLQGFDPVLLQITKPIALAGD